MTSEREKQIRQTWSRKGDYARKAFQHQELVRLAHVPELKALEWTEEIEYTSKANIDYSEYRLHQIYLAEHSRTHIWNYIECEGVIVEYWISQKPRS